MNNIAGGAQLKAKESVTSKVTANSSKNSK